MPEKLYVNADALIRVVGDAWAISNPRLRTHVEIDPAAIAALSAIRTGPVDSWTAALETAKGRDRTVRGMGASGLHTDHSGWRSDDGRWLSGAELVELLRARRILVATDAEEIDAVRPLTGLLDRASLGTFHERVGQYLMLERRAAEPWREWHDQKFSSDGATLLDNTYRQLQEPFFDSYFGEGKVKGARVLDFGCGNGYYSSKFARFGAHVTGIDNSEALLDIARANHSGENNLQFILTKSFEAALEMMGAWEAGSFDLIYLQDTLLLLLQPEAGKPSPLLPEVFRSFRRLLRPSGTLCAMEPNPVFWLAGRYGNARRPYAIATEYRNPVFNVAPTLDRVLDAFAPCGFALKELRNPAPASDSAEASYSREFPIWDFMVFVPLPS